MKPIEELNLPSDLKQILAKEGYWEDRTFTPINIIIEEVSYQETEMISYQLSFDVLEGHQEIDGGGWEELIRIYIEERNIELARKIKGDSESSTCVLWIDNEPDFRSMLQYMIELLGNELEIERIKRRIGNL